MGHTRLGRLPKYLRWKQVVALLEESPGNAEDVSRATAVAADEWLLRLKSDPSLTYCFWLLTRVTWAARSDSFAEQLQSFGLDVNDGTSNLAFIASLVESARTELSHHPESGPASELASLALRRALSETVGQQGRTLFGSSLSDLQVALRTYSTKERFGELAQRFFGDFLSRTLRSFLDREIPNLVGESSGLRNVEDSAEVIAAIDLHARQSAAILRDFSGGWFAKHNWESRGQIGEDETRRFVAFALEKLRSELKREVDR